MRRRILPFILAGGLSIAAVGPAAAAPPANVGAASGLVNVLVGVALRNVDILNNSLNDVVEVNINDSLNNLLQNALQNADILNGLEVRIFDILNNLNVNVEDVTITVLDDGVVQVVVLGAGGVIDTITLI
jgi:hypothetical protein